MKENQLNNFAQEPYIASLQSVESSTASLGHHSRPWQTGFVYLFGLYPMPSQLEAGTATKFHSLFFSMHTPNFSCHQGIAYSVSSTKKAPHFHLSF